MASDKTAGAMLTLSGLGSIGLMAVHPTSNSPSTVISGVHGSLLIVMLVQASALLWLLKAKTLRDLAASVFYSVGMIATVGAGVLNGFLFPMLKSYQEPPMSDELFALVWSLNQVLAELGVIGVGIGIAAWSLGLWMSGERKLAGFGWIAGIGPSAGLVLGLTDMHLHGAMAAYGIQGAWVIALGVTRWRAG
ncbi:MAG: hypothetical protein KJP27_09245 [Altererythrobacter sp.]|nr:hypothetical protein [Altererythrobacter sp.]